MMRGFAAGLAAIAAWAVASAGWADPAPPEQRASFRERPPGETFSLFYPRLAYSQGVQGSAILECAAHVNERIDCAVVSESPIGWGFGEAAVAASRSFRIQPAMRNGAHVEDTMRIPVHFTQSGDTEPAPGELDLPLWEAAPTPDVVKVQWAQTANGREFRARGVLSCLVMEARTLKCEVAREFGAGSGVAALALVDKFKVDEDEHDFVARHRTAPFILPINLGFPSRLEPVSRTLSGLDTLGVAIPREATAQVYPPAAHASGTTGKVVIVCASRETEFDCRVSEESPQQQGFGEAAMILVRAFSSRVFDAGGSYWPFLVGDVVRFTAPFEAR